MRPMVSTCAGPSLRSTIRHVTSDLWADTRDRLRQRAGVHKVEEAGDGLDREEAGERKIDTPQQGAELDAWRTQVHHPGEAREAGVGQGPRSGRRRRRCHWGIRRKGSNRIVPCRGLWRRIVCMHIGPDLRVIPGGWCIIF